MNKSARKYIYSFLLLVLILLKPYNSSAIAKQNDYLNNKILQTAEHAMKINASAIVSNGDILCVVKDSTTANKILTDIYNDMAKCSDNEVLVNISWENKPDIINVKEYIFNIIDSKKAVQILRQNSRTSMYGKTASADGTNVIKINDEPYVTSVKYIKEIEIIEHKTTVEYSKSLYIDQNQIKQNGIDGVVENIYQVEYVNDAEHSRELIKTKEIVKPQHKIIIKGTKEKKREAFIIPAGDVLTSTYGNRNGKMHLGVDIAGAEGSCILASKDGIIVRAEQYFGYGKCIDIVHNDGSWTRYGHLDEYLVEKGEKVKQGQKIGIMGNTGNSTGRHLHFEIRYGNWPNGRTIDPSYVLDLSQLKK